MVEKHDRIPTTHKFTDTKWSKDLGRKGKEWFNIYCRGCGYRPVQGYVKEEAMIDKPYILMVFQCKICNKEWEEPFYEEQILKKQRRQARAESGFERQKKIDLTVRLVDAYLETKDLGILKQRFPDAMHQLKNNKSGMARVLREDEQTHRKKVRGRKIDDDINASC